MAAAALSRLDPSRIHLFRADDYDGGESWTVQDLDDIVRNHRLLYPALWRPPIGLGHVRPTPENAHTADLAYGEVARLWREGQDLWGAYAAVSPELEQLLAGGYLRSPSVELYRDPSEGNFSDRVMPGLHGAMLRRVVYVGAWPPRVKGLAQPSWAAGESARLYCTRPGRIFSEATVSDTNRMQEVAQKAGFGDTFLQSLDENQMGLLIADLHDRVLSGGTSSDQGTADADTAGQDDTGADTGADMTTPSRDQMVSDLVAAGQDQQTVEQMDDAALAELWQQLQGTGGAAGGTSAAPSTYAERDRKGKNKSELQNVVHLSMRTLRELVRAEARTAAAKVTAPDRARKVVEFCEQAVRDGYLTPAQVERDAKGQPLGPVIKRLLRASPICFAEGVPSELDQQMEEIRAGGQVRTYGERLAGTDGGAVGTTGADAAFEARLKKHYDARLARFSKG